MCYRLVLSMNCFFVYILLSSNNKQVPRIGKTRGILTACFEILANTTASMKGLPLSEMQNTFLPPQEVHSESCSFIPAESHKLFHCHALDVQRSQFPPLQ